MATAFSYLLTETLATLQLWQQFLPKKLWQQSIVTFFLIKKKKVIYSQWLRVFPLFLCRHQVKTGWQHKYEIIFFKKKNIYCEKK